MGLSSVFNLYVTLPFVRQIKITSIKSREQSIFCNPNSVTEVTLIPFSFRSLVETPGKNPNIRKTTKTSRQIHQNSYFIVLTSMYKYETHM